MDIPLNQGRIDVQKCGELCGRLIDLRSVDEIFLCGPEVMIFTVKEWLGQQGVDGRKIHFELFHTREGGVSDGHSGGRSHPSPEGRSKRDDRVCRVTLRLDGASHGFDVPFDGPSLLDAALMEGVDLPFACKGGVCCTCRARLVEGQVEMNHNYALEADELAAGFILTCQSHPRTEKVIVDFDSK